MRAGRRQTTRLDVKLLGHTNEEDDLTIAD